MNDRVLVAGIVAGFAVSRAAAFAAGIRFDVSPLPWYWQYIDPELLSHRLLESLYYSHAQPPLFNLLLGLTLKTFPANFGWAMHVEYLAMGLIATLGLYVLLTQLRMPAGISALLATLVSVSPAMLLYENWLFYEYPTMTLLVLAAVALHRFLTRESFVAGLTFCCLCAAIVYLRAVFQIVWLLVVFGALLLAIRPRLLITCCGVPLLAVVLLYGKNLALFGTPTTSSWLGMNLSRGTTYQLDRDTLEQFIAEGSLHPISLVGPFASVDAYSKIVEPPAVTGIPVLDSPRKPGGEKNFHALIYVQVSRALLADALWVIRHRPVVYRDSVRRAIESFLSPSTDTDELDTNRETIEAYDKFVRDYVYVRIGRLHNLGLGILAAYLFVAAYAALVVANAIRRRRSPEPTEWTILFIAFTAGYVSIVSCLGEVGENQRMRFVLDPVVLALVAGGVRQLWLEMRGILRTGGR